MPAPEAVAAGLMASQKSSPVAVTVISYITNDVVQQGLMAIPALVGQIFQVFIGSALVPLFTRVVKRWEAAQDAHILAGQGTATAAASGAEEGRGTGEGEELCGSSVCELVGQGSKSCAEGKDAATAAAGATAAGTEPGSEQASDTSSSCKGGDVEKGQAGSKDGNHQQLRQRRQDQQD